MASPDILMQMFPQMDPTIVLSVWNGIPGDDIQERMISCIDLLMDMASEAEATAPTQEAESVQNQSTNPSSPPCEERRLGVVIFAGIDKNNTQYAKVEDEQTKQEHYFHISNLLDGAVLQKGLRVSYVLVESRVKPGDMRAEKVRVEDETARRRGVVKLWNVERNYGFVVETGATQKYYWFGDKGWKGTLPPLVGVPVEFSGGKSTNAKYRNKLEAQNVVPVTPSSSSSSSSSSPLTPVQTPVPVEPVPGAHTPVTPADQPIPTPAPGTEKVYILWDFDQTYNWGKVRTVAVYQAILERLLRDGFIATKAQPTATAYGTVNSLRDQWVVQALSDMGVVRKLQSGLKKEQVDGEIEREATVLAALPDTATIVIISSDKGFSQLIRSLVQQGKRTVLFHEAPAGSAHEQILCMYVHKAYRLAELGVPPTTPALQHTTSALQHTTPEARRHGRITDVKPAKNSAMWGHIEDNESRERYFFHSSHVQAGVNIAFDVPVSFALAPNPKDPPNSMAVQIAADEPPSTPTTGAVMRRGTVLSWDPVKGIGFIGEPGEARNVFFLQAAWQSPEHETPRPRMAVDFLAEDNRNRSDQRFGTFVTPAAGAHPRASPLLPHQPQQSPILPSATGVPGSPAVTSPHVPQPTTPLGASAAAAVLPGGSTPPPPASSDARCQGTVARTSPQRRRGLIRPAAGGASIGFSFDAVRPNGVVAEGAAVSYTIDSTPGGVQAVNVIVQSHLQAAVPTPPVPAAPASPPADPRLAEYAARFRGRLPDAELHAILLPLLATPGLSQDDLEDQVNLTVALAISSL